MTGVGSSTIPPAPNVGSRLPLELYRTRTVGDGTFLSPDPADPATSILPLGCTRSADTEGKTPVGTLVTNPPWPNVVSSWPVGKNRARANSVAWSIPLD